VRKAETDLYFQKGKSFYSPLKQTSELSALIKSEPASVRFIFLVPFDGDSRSPIISVMQRFLVEDADDRVKTFNNVRRHPLNVALDTYQKSSRDGQDGDEYEDLTEWFYLGPGMFRNRDFVDTSHWPDPRRLLAISPSPEKAEEIRSYLLAMDGVREQGSCVDFSPHVAASTRKVTFVIRDLRATEAGDYRDPFRVSVELP